MTRETPLKTHLLPLVAVSVPDVKVNGFSKGNGARSEEDLLSGHSSAQPLRTHELHGTALLTSDEKDGFEGHREFKIHLSHFSFDLEIWKSVTPVVRVREISKPAAFCARQGTSAVARSRSYRAGRGGNSGWGHWL